MNMVPKFISDNQELLLYLDGKLHITILGGIKLTGFDRLKVTLKIAYDNNPHTAFRHNLDLYNSIQAEQLVEKAAEALDIAAAELARIISRLTSALENYRTERLEAMKPRQAEKKGADRGRTQGGHAIPQSAGPVRQDTASHRRQRHYR